MIFFPWVGAKIQCLFVLFCDRLTNRIHSRPTQVTTLIVYVIKVFIEGVFNFIIISDMTQTSQSHITVKLKLHSSTKYSVNF